ncbi:hypothetical protein F5X97DRAFT_327704 [Nemania serpens]|nr:hypothetical protein F5X97DRAFT_327704 [Nemania serpens]
MADAVSENIKPLPRKVTTELEGVAEWLQSPDASFEATNDVKICTNTKGLATVTAKLLQHFAVEVAGFSDLGWDLNLKS